MTTITCEPAALAYTINDAARVSGLSRSRLYELAAAGRIVFRKIGRRSLIRAADLQSMIDSLPAAPTRTRPA